MFDLNELPENEGPAGRAASLLYCSAAGGGGGGGAAKAEEFDDEDDVVFRGGLEDEEEEDDDDEDEDEDEDEEEDDEEVEGEQQVFYSSGNSAQILCRLIPEGEEVEAKEPPQSFLRLDSSSSMCYPNDWQPPLGLASFNESEIDTDNEVTVAALDARAILDSQCVTGLDSAVSLVLPTEPGASFGISPQPEKLGQRAESSRKQRPDFTNFHRSAGKWDGFVVDKRGSERLEDELSLDSRQSPLYPGIVSARKGKRAREEGNHATGDPVIKLKRHSRPASTLAGPEAHHGAGPSLSMALDQDVAAANISPSASAYKMASKGVGLEREGATSLSLGESALTGFESTTVVRPGAHPALGLKSKLGLSMTATPIGRTVDVAADNLDAVSNVSDYRQRDEIAASMKGLDRKVSAGRGHEQPLEAVVSEKPFWHGKLCVQGFSAIVVEGYCSEDLQPASKLWSLPQVMAVENLVKIEEFLAAVRKVNVAEPVVRLRLLPDAASNGQCFSSLVKSLNSEKKGRTKDRLCGPEMQLGLENGSHSWRNGPLACAGVDYVFVASLKLKQQEEARRRTSANLYLVLGSSCEAISGVDREFGRRLREELDWSCRPDENVLFGFLCVSEEGRFADSSRVPNAKPEESPIDIEGSTRKDSPRVVLTGLSLNNVEIVVDSAIVNSRLPKEDAAVHRNLQCEDGDIVADAEVEESTVADDDIHATKSKIQKDHIVDGSHESRHLDRARGRKDNHGLRHNHSSTDDCHKDRDRQRDRDRDLRGRERDKDLRNSNKDVHRHSHRSNDRLDFSKRDRSKDREVDRFRERMHRDSHRDVTERPKSSRERMKELEIEKQKERQREREKERERERFVRKRDRSAEPDKGTIDDLKLALKSEKAASTVKEESGDQLLHLPGQENRKRIRVDSEDRVAHDTVVSEIRTSKFQSEVTKRATGGVDMMAEPGKTVVLHNKNLAGGTLQGEAGEHVTDSGIVEQLSRAETEVFEGNPMNVEAVQVDMGHNDRAERIKEMFAGHKEQTATPPSTTGAPPFNGTGRAVPSNIDMKIVGHEISLVAKESDTAQVSDPVANIIKANEEPRVSDVDGFRVVEDEHQDGRGHPQEHVIEGVSEDIKDVQQAGSEGKNLGDGIVEFHGKLGEQDMAADAGVSEPSYDPREEERTSNTEILNDVQQRKARFSRSVEVDNMYGAAEGQKSDNNEASQDVEALPKRSLDGTNAIPSTDKTVNSGGDDSGNLIGAESPMDNELAGSSPGLSDEVSCEIELEGCDKETRVWLVSKQNAFYLSEEFGVRIARLEEVANAKSDVRMKTQQGPVNVRIFLATEKSTNSNESKWFINQAADVLRALASRGVFVKCIWYQGQVQRYAGDQAPSIQVIGKRIKGEDGKNLERIQEETGVMIGIVLDANTRKGNVNSTRVIGLRLKGTRNKGLQEATKLVEHLLSQVAEQFSKDTSAVLTGSQDVALLKLKVDLSNTTSPSSGILTPLQKDVFAAYSPVSPVPAISPLGSFKCKLDEPSSDARYTSSATAPPAVLPDSTPSVNPGTATLGDFTRLSQQSEDERPDNGLTIPDLEVKRPRPLVVRNLPDSISSSILRTLFEDVLRQKFGLPSSYEGVSDMILDVRLAPENYCACVEFASDELLLDVLKMYADSAFNFFDLILEIGPSASLTERMFLDARTETASKGLDYGGGIVDSPTFSRPRSGRKAHKSEDHFVRVSTLRSSAESDIEVTNQDRRLGGRDGAGRYLREKPKPLFLTELMRNASARSIHNLFEDIIKKYINPSLGNFKGRATVLDVRYIPSRGCAFVDLATSELVDFMLDLRSRRPEVFYHMKMEIGRRPVPLGQGEEEPVVKRSSHLGRSALVEESHSYGSGRRGRAYFLSASPSPRGNELAVIDHDFMDDYEEDEDDERQPSTARKRRSDPERTVYADRLPDNASEGMIRRIFERVLRENMTDEQREMLGENIITEVRYVPTKFCAFVVFVAEELTRLVLQLYNQDEEIFKSMRLKPHFHSRMEDLYREDLHDRENGPTHRLLSRDHMPTDRRNRSGLDDFQNGYVASDIGDLGHRGRNSSAHRAVAATAFKEVDRRRSVYVDRIPEWLPEPKMRELFERALRQPRHGYSSRSVSQVTFFRDKFDPDKLCAFVELDHEDLVQKLLNAYNDDEEAFSGMRVRPAVKYGN